MLLHFALGYAQNEDLTPPGIVPSGIVTFLQTLAASTYGLILALAGACAGVWLVSGNFRLLRRKRLILGSPASKVRSAALGLVEICGLAVGPYTINAALSGMSCFYYRTLAWQLKQSGKAKKWEKVADESMHVPFYLDDNTGRMLIDPQGANLDLQCEIEDEFNTLRFSNRLNLPANIASFLNRHGVATDKSVRIEEYCIKPKNMVFVLGTLTPNPGLTASASPVATVSGDQSSFESPSNSSEIGRSATTKRSAMVSQVIDVLPSASTNSNVDVASDPGFDDGMVEVIRLGGGERPSAAAAMTQQEKVAAALSKAGISGPAGWTDSLRQPVIAINASRGGAAAAAAPALAFDLKPGTVLMKSVDEPGLFISWRSQRDVVQALGWKSALTIWGGPALTVISGCILIAHFAWR